MRQSVLRSSIHPTGVEVATGFSAVLMPGVGRC